MTRREIRVYTRHSNPKVSREELRFATKFMFSLLVTGKIHDECTIWVESCDLRGPEELDGETYVHSSDVFSKKPRWFRIRISKYLSKKRQLSAIAHELVHCKQFAKGQLGFSYLDTKTGIKYTKWKRRLVNEKKVCYFDLAWEIEAYGREYGLYKRYVNFVKEHRIKFKPDKKSP